VPNPFTLRFRQRERLCAVEFFILPGELLLFVQGSFPVLFQRASDESILRFDCLILSCRTIRLINSALMRNAEPQPWRCNPDFERGEYFVPITLRSQSPQSTRLFDPGDASSGLRSL
jgi:hypothetical protein